jgi:hypothetical protein
MSVRRAVTGGLEVFGKLTPYRAHAELHVLVADVFNAVIGAAIRVRHLYTKGPSTP